jgi:DNA-directed RNA polymerase subunit M/transcription elongation factor TFIIS
MALAFYCTDCGDLLGDINTESRIMYCTRCHKPQELPEDDKTVMIIASVETGSKSRIITNMDCMNLHGLPTTSKIAKDCPKCSFGYASQISDMNYKFTLICLKCNYVYN